MPYIVETIITTRNHEGEVHIAPLGLIEDGADGAGMDAAAWIIAPFRPSRTLDNLLANAVAASPAASTIDVRLRRSAEDPDTVALHVTDHGAGMSAAARARATERHWHRSESGHGLGLAIVTRLCEHNRATLRLDETPGGGLDAVVVLRAAPSGGAA